MSQESEIKNKGVAYAVKHKDEMPENIKTFIQDLYGYEEVGKRLDTARNDALKTVEKIEEQMSHLFGSIEAIVRVIAREIGPEKLKEYADKFMPSEEIKQ